MKGIVKQSVVGLLTLALATSSIAQNGAEKKDPVLLKIQGEAVTLSEFESIYKKNNTNNNVDEKSLEEYLELFINFKLKVKEAEELGMHKDEAFVSELAGYRKQLAKPYLVDESVTDALVKEAYDRMKQDVRASHILIRVSEDASPKDTLFAYNKIKSLKSQIEKGASFSELATKFSEDPSAANNKGDLGYFSALQMVYPFENAAYTTKVGKVSDPIRSKFGYHIVYVKDRRPARGQIRAAHILVSVRETDGQNVKDAAKAKIDEIYQKLQNNESFEELAAVYSDDKSSAKKGGELPWFGTGRMVLEFEDAAFALKNDNDISKPIKTQYGWHIIKRLEVNEMGEFDKLEESIKRKVERDGRGKRSRDAVISRVKKEYHFSPNLSTRNEFYKVVDNSFFDGRWSIEQAEGMKKVMFSLHDDVYGSNSKREYTQQDFAKYISGKQRRLPKDKPRKDIKILVDELFNEFVEESCIAFEDANLEYKYADFRALMREYRDGILLFELMDDKVWSKAVKDTAGLEAYYEANKSQFMWDERMNASAYTCANAEIAKKVRKIVKKRRKKGLSDKDIHTEINTDSQLNLVIESGKYLKGESELLDGIAWEKGITEDMTRNDKIVFVEVVEIIKPEPKTLKEARGLVTAAYQNHLEKEWVKELRAKYTVEVDHSVLSLIK